ncbi:unnamed protein product, partial [Larinioides sclopetarius]
FLHHTSGRTLPSTYSKFSYKEMQRRWFSRDLKLTHFKGGEFLWRKFSVVIL